MRCGNPIGSLPTWFPLMSNRPGNALVYLPPAAITGSEVARSTPRYAAVIFRALREKAAICTAEAPVNLHHFCQLSSRIR